MQKPIIDAGITRRQVLTAIAVAGIACAAPAVNAQASWRPSGTIRLVVPWPAGGPTDVLARLIATGLGERGMQAIVENRPGATGTVGAEHVYRATPDGTTPLVTTSDTLSIFPQLTKTRFDPARFVPVTGMGGIPLYLVGRQDLPARNLDELVALARKQDLSYANAGNGGALHMASVAFGRAAKVSAMTHVPFQGAVPQVQAILGKQVDLAMTTGSLAAQQKGRLHIYGGSGAKRLPGLQEVPTFSEQGLPLEIVSWSGVVAPPETSLDIANELAKVVGEITASGAYQAKLADLMMSPYTMNQSEFSRFLNAEHRKWGELVKASNVRLD